jgi:hypothetical protein
MQGFECKDHFFQVIDILPVHDQVDGEGQAMLANPRGQFKLVRVGARSGDPVGMALALNPES